MFADDVKLFRIIRTIDDCRLLQRDLDKLYEWSLKWQLLFNPLKCQLLRLGNPPPYRYTLREVNSGEDISINEEKTVKDLGVFHQQDLKPATQVKAIVAKATRVCFTIKRTIEHLTMDSGKALFCALVRPLLEYAVSVWCPYHQKDIQSLEKVQRRYTKWIRPLRNLTYSERLKELNLFSLKHRRRRGDLINMFLLKVNEDHLITNKLARRDNHHTRGHSSKIEAERCQLSQRSNFLSNRARKDWNSLPQRIVSAPNLESFKRQIDHLWANDPTRFK